MRHFPNVAKLPTVAFLMAACITGGCLLVFGTDARAIRHTLAITARFSYVWFWLAYAGSALAFFFPRFWWLARRGRELGLAFASAHSVHLLLIIWLYQKSPVPPFSGAVIGYFGFAVMYLLALLSIKRVNQLLWRPTMLIGMEYIEYVFMADFWFNPLQSITKKQLVAYLPFMVAGVLGTSLRLSRWSVQGAMRLASA